MNKDLKDWLKKKMSQIDERVTNLEDHILSGEEDEW